MSNQTHYNDILDFWFKELQPKQWWTKDKAMDDEIQQRFLAIHNAATALELHHWRDSAQGRLAEIIVLDQFSRNIFRDQPQAFAYDGIALALAQEAIKLGSDKALSTSEKSFMYLPYMHSESLAIHDIAITLFDQEGLENNLDFEHRHRVIIERFGRYPHRNEILGRVSTEEEIQFLSTKGSSF